MKYNHLVVEPKWQKAWEEKGCFHAEENSDKKKFYALIEFPYPSGQGLQHQADGRRAAIPPGAAAYGLCRAECKNGWSGGPLSPAL